MKRYIEQLLEDIRKAAASAPHLHEQKHYLTDEEELDEHFEEIESYVHGENNIPLSSIVGIPANMLPAPSKLSRAQIKLLVKELVRMLNSWNFYPDFPENVPDEMKYRALISVWDSEQTYMRSGQMHIEFCDYDPEKCPFPGYCDACEEITFERDRIDNAVDADIDDWIDPEGMVKEVADRLNSMNLPFADFIPGIFNYCDRWCERCNFTDRCESYQFEKELRGHTEEGDELPSLKKKPNEQDDSEDQFDEFDEFPVDEIDEDLYDEEDYFSLQKKSDRHPLVIIAEKYSMDAYKWLIKTHKHFEDNLTYWLAKGYADLMSGEFDVLFYYNFFIHVKLKRAVWGYIEQQDFEEDTDDMNGSAKVALLSIDRMLEALKTLKRHLRSERERLESFKKQLEKIRYDAEELFPEARSFVRPGLDE
jgi:hypothetical protein